MATHWFTTIRARVCAPSGVGVYALLAEGVATREQEHGRIVWRRHQLVAHRARVRLQLCLKVAVTPCVSVSMGYLMQEDGRQDG